jgi:hypothetical protein
MHSPFPGMNPYLENPRLWSEVHSRLIIALADAIAPQIRPQYRVAVEQRIYKMSEENSVLVGIPDVTVGHSFSANQRESHLAVATPPPTKPVIVNIPLPEVVRENYLEIREVNTGVVVTAIEILSPKNKRAGAGRKAYEGKRQQILGSLTHLVEIDLLRSGEHPPILGESIQSDYRILVSRSEFRPQAELYPFNLPEPIPTFSLPLRQKDPEPVIDLQILINGVYDRAGFDLVINYNSQPIPPVRKADMAWLDEVISKS